MQKIILQMQISLDGFIAGTQDEMDWIDQDPTMGKTHLALAEGANLAVMGHAVYEGMAGAWPMIAASPDAPANEVEFAGVMNRMPKLVITNTTFIPEWTSVSVFESHSDEDLAAELSSRTQDGDGYILVYGGHSLAQTLIRLGLVSEFHLDICPVYLGSGKPLFANRQDLTLVSAAPYPSGSIGVIYTPVDQRSKADIV